MSSQAPTARPAASPDRQGINPAAYRWMRPLAVFAVGFVVTTAFRTHPHPEPTASIWR